MRAAFGGDEAAFRPVNPLEELRSAHLPASVGELAVGRDDPDFGLQARRVTEAIRAAGVTVSLQEFTGGHSWTMAAEALGRALLWISTRTGLLGPEPT